MVVVPATPPFTPGTTPVVEILPLAGMLLVHVPPGVEFNVVVAFTHTANEGLAVIAAGLGLIVITVVIMQPVGRV